MHPQRLDAPQHGNLIGRIVVPRPVDWDPSAVPLVGFVLGRSGRLGGVVTSRNRIDARLEGTDVVHRACPTANAQTAFPSVAVDFSSIGRGPSGCAVEEIKPGEDLRAGNRGRSLPSTTHWRGSRDFRSTTLCRSRAVRESPEIAHPLAGWHR